MSVALFRKRLYLLVFLVAYGGNVSAHVPLITNCYISILRDLNFKNYNPFRLRNDSASGHMEVKCNSGGRVRYQIALSQGYFGSYQERKMRWYEGNEYINYNIYTNYNRTRVWGDGTQGSKKRTYTGRTPFTKRYAIYGLIPALQTKVRPGRYYDVIFYTITY